MSDEKKAIDILTEMYSILSQVKQAEQNISETGTTGQASDNTLQEWVYDAEGGGISGRYFIPKSAIGGTITISEGIINHIGVGDFSSTYPTTSLGITGGIEVLPNYVIGRYKYSDNTISFVEQSTGPDLTLNDYFEFEVCRAWLDDSGDDDVAVVVNTNYYINPIVFGGVLKS